MRVQTYLKIHSSTPTVAFQMNNLYLQLNYDQYKALEDQLVNYRQLESTHRTVEGAYHKAFRLQVTESLIIEFQGPLVKSPLGS